MTPPYLASLHHELFWACQNGRWNNVLHLLKAGVDINWTDTQGWTLLHYACAQNNVIVLQGLITREINMNQQTCDGETALHIASSHGFELAVKLLIDYGADPMVADRMWSTPLHRACGVGRTAIVHVLLEEASVAIDAKDDEGFTPLHVACYLRQHGVVQILLAHGANVNEVVTTKDLVLGRLTPLVIASSLGHSEIVCELLEANAYVDSIGTSGETPLHMSASDGFDHVSKLLIDYGADVNRKEMIQKLTPLLKAVLSWQTNTVLLLLKAGANPDAADSDGFTPLYYASIQGNSQMVTTLLSYGADMTMATCITLAETAMSCKHFDICRIFTNELSDTLSPKGLHAKILPFVASAIRGFFAPPSL